MFYVKKKDIYALKSRQAFLDYLDDEVGSQISWNGNFGVGWLGE